MHNQSLTGQVALVTGGGRGIGASVATHLAGAGARVAVFGRSAAHVEAVAARIGDDALAVTGDVTDRAALQAAVARTEAAFGPIDLLVNNAGISGTAGDLAHVDAAAWWRTQEVNVLGVLLACQAVLPGMLVRGAGRIVHMGSMAGNTPGPGISDYSVSKTALLRLNEALASENADTGIVSIAVSPGWVWTDMTDHLDRVFRDTRDNWTGIDDAAIFPPETVARLIVRIAQGDADRLSGRFLHVSDDLDDILADQERILAEDLLLLRLRGRS